MTLLSIDPGARDLAWALWKGDRLTDCGLARTKSRDLGARCLDLATQVPGADLVAVEQMIAYPGGGNTKAAQAKRRAILELQAIGFFVAGYVGWEVHPLPARTWKGQIPKEVCQRRIDQRLTVQERDVLAARLFALPKSLQHNVWDAVGIGLFTLGRF